MNTLDDLLAMPEGWRHRRGVWRKFTRGDSLFRALCDAVRNCTVSRAEVLLDVWRQEFVEYQKSRDKQIQFQWNIVQALLTCAKIAKLEQNAVVQLLDLLLIFDSNAEVPDGITGQAASLNSSDNWLSESWRQFVRQWLYKLTYQPPLNVEWVWDTVTTMWGCPRSATHSESLTVLLVVVEDGVTATLTLERLSDEGNRVFYPDPATMSFVTCNDEFQEAEQNAVAYVRGTEKLWRDDSKVDVRWKLGRQDGKPLTHLVGGSLGGAFALGLAKLFADMPGDQSPG